MGRQLGNIRISGSFDEFTFYVREGKALVRKKSSLTSERVKTSPDFLRTRENAVEFHRAIQAGQLIRALVAAYVKEVADSGLTARMNGVMKQVLNGDRSHVRGGRLMQDGDLGILRGFNFNEGQALADVLPVACCTHLDAATGAIKIAIPSFIPLLHIKAPAGATHFRLVVWGAALDFDQRVCTGRMQDTALMALDETPTGLLAFEYQANVAAGQVLMLVAGIAFYMAGTRGAGDFSRVKGGAMAIKRVMRKG